MIFNKLVGNESGLGIVAVIALAALVGTAAGIPKAPNGPASTKDRVAKLEQQIEILTLNLDTVRVQQAAPKRVVKKQPTYKQLTDSVAAQLRKLQVKTKKK